MFSIGETTIVQASIASGQGAFWGGPEHPGYWVYCLDNGRVAGRVFYRDGHGFRLGAVPDRSRSRPIARPFEGIDGILKTVLVGEGDRAYLKTAKAADVVTWWFYIRELVYAFPLGEFEQRPKRIAVLASFQENHKDPKHRGTLSLSGDGKTWLPVDLSAKRQGTAYVIEIPEALVGGPTLWIRMTGGSSTVGGFAFLEE